MGKKWSKRTRKFCLPCSISQEPYMIWLPFVVDKCKMITSRGIFFMLSVRWKCKNCSKWYKTLSAMPYISSYDLHFCYTCVKEYVQGFFIFFANVNLWGQQWGNSAKNGPKWQKIMSVTLHISRNIHHTIVVFVNNCKIMISPGVFLYFFKNYNNVNIKILTSFIGLLQQFF